MWEELTYFCSVCGCALSFGPNSLFDDDFDLHRFPQGERSLEWLKPFYVLMREPPSFAACVDAHPGAQVWWVNGTLESDHIEACESQQIVIDDPRIPTPNIGVYDFTNEPIPGVAFPIHTTCREFILRENETDFTSEDLHEALSRDWDWATAQHDKEKGQPRWENYMRNYMEYKHEYYGAWELIPNGLFESLDLHHGQEWLYTDPFPSPDAVCTELLVAGLPKVDRSAPRMDTEYFAARDPFTKFPPELIVLLSEFLGWVGWRALRKASPAVAGVHLPQALCSNLLLRTEIGRGLGCLETPDVDWRQVLERLENNDFSVLDGDVTVKNRARIYNLVQELVSKATECKKRRMRGESPIGAVIWDADKGHDKNSSLWGRG